MSEPGVTGASSAFAVSRLHFAIPLPVESLHVAAAASKPAVPWPQAPAQELQQVCRDLSSLVVDPTHHNVPTACETKETCVRGGTQGACTALAPRAAHS